MALADIISLVSSEKDLKIRSLTEVQEKEMKELLATSEEEGKKYSIKKFNEFEILQSLLQKKADSEIKKYQKIEMSKFQRNILDAVFSTLVKKIASFSEKDQIDFYAKKIAEITDTEGEIVSLGTSSHILESAIKTAGKSFSVAEEAGNGGFIFKGDRFTVDFTLDSLVQAEFREKNEVDLLNKLFA